MRLRGFSLLSTAGIVAALFFTPAQAQTQTLVVGALAVRAVGTRLRLPAPLLLLAVGLGVSFVPGMPDFPLEPDAVLALVLPPLVLICTRA